MKLIIPGIPPSANHYRGLNRRTGRFYVRKPAVAFKADVAHIARGQKMPDAKAYLVEIIVFLPKRGRGDADNFSKVVLDALQAAGIIANDSRVQRVSIEKLRDADNPRTEIVVRAI